MSLDELRRIVSDEMRKAHGKGVSEIRAATQRANVALQQYKADGGTEAGNVLEGLLQMYFQAKRDGGDTDVSTAH